MKLEATTCPACNATIHIPPDEQRVTCAYCSRELAITQKGNDTSVALLGQLNETLHDLGQQTKTAIQDSSGITQAELERLQWNQQLTALQMQRTTLRSEIRALEREPNLSRTARRQLRELRQEERAYTTQIVALEAKLNPTPPPAATHSTRAATNQGSSLLGKAIRPFKGCLAGCVTYFVVAIGLGMFAVPLDEWLFDIPLENSRGGPLFTITAIIGLIAAAFVFFYVLFPQAAIWQKLRPRTQKKTE